jgi:hypothetical protein
MAMSPDDPSFLQKLRGIIDQGTAPYGGATNLGLAMLANSGYSTTPRTFGQTIGISALQAQQMQQEKLKAQQEQQDADLMRRYREAQIAKLGQPSNENQPPSVKEYEYAKQNGFKGSFQEWITAGGQSSRPSSVQEWEFYSSLPPDQKKLYLEMKRNPNMFVKDVGQVPTVIAPSVSGTTTTPLSTLQNESTSASAIKQAEASGGALGKAQGDIAGGIQTKGSDAKGAQNILDIADPLIDIATGSAAGAARDKVAAMFGSAPDSAKAIAQLQVLQAGLMLSQPRMEGPQGEKDVELYQKAAGQIGDPSVPAAIKKAAVQTIRQLQNKYIERAGKKPEALRKTVNGKSYVQQDGQWYEDAP